MVKRVSYLSCIFCGKRAPLTKLSVDSFYVYDPSWACLTISECAGGHGFDTKGGFPVVGALSIVEMAKDPAYANLVDLIKGRLLKITKALVAEHIISREDLAEVSA